MPSSLNEASLEALVVAQIQGDGPPTWREGNPASFNAAYGFDLAELAAFLSVTQPEKADSLDLENDSPARRKFLSRLQGEIVKRGIVDVLRNGVKDGPRDLDLYSPLPTPGNPVAAERFAANRLTITRQVHYSPSDAGKSIDLVAFVNGLPIATLELKNQITKQRTEDAVIQYKRDRSPKEHLFKFGVCAVHFAVDDQSIRFCTKLAGNDSWFLPFDQGWKDGAGNPPNPDGIATDYLWKRILAPESLANIVENYAQIVEEKNQQTGTKSRVQIFPRYHQLDVVRRLLADVEARGAGQRYLVEHSAGSGKSNSIAWLAHQLTSIRHGGDLAFDSVIVVTDRIILDTQIRDTIRNFTQLQATVKHAESAKDLGEFIASGRKIIITTVQKFPFVVSSIGTTHKDRRFAIIIDEAHSSQGGKAAAALKQVLSDVGIDDPEADIEDAINQIVAAKRFSPNASYFAFTATPKNKTLETFGEPYLEDDVTKHRPFHTYTMKQAIQEGFILDVLENYTEIHSYYQLMKTVEDDPEFDARRAAKKLRAFVEGQKDAIRLKAEIMVDHFDEQVVRKHKIKGRARAMVVTGSIERAIDYYEAISDYLRRSGKGYQALVAFSDLTRDGVHYTESHYNGFPGSQIASRFRESPYRILVCAEKFQTGYDEPLLHTMYVDKILSGVKAVQTLSRLNRAHPDKSDTAILDFANSPDDIKKAFDPYYRTTLLSDETDPNKLHDLVAELDAARVFEPDEVETFVTRYLGNAGREELDPLLDICAARYRNELELDEQIRFKSSAKAFVRTYDFLSAILPWGSPAWEKYSIFLHFLIPKLPTPQDPDLAVGIVQVVDLESYRVERRERMKIVLDDVDAEIEPVPLGAGGGAVDPDMQRLSEIVEAFNRFFGDTDFEDKDRIIHRLTVEIPERVAADEKYRVAAQNNDEANAKVEAEAALGRVMLSLIKDEGELYKRYSDDEDFRRLLLDTVFRQTYRKSA